MGCQKERSITYEPMGSRRLGSIAGLWHHRHAQLKGCEFFSRFGEPRWAKQHSGTIFQSSRRGHKNLYGNLPQFTSLFVIGGFMVGFPANLAASTSAMTNFGFSDEVTIIKESHQLAFGGGVGLGLLFARAYARCSTFLLERLRFWEQAQSHASDCQSRRSSLSVGPIPTDSIRTSDRMTVAWTWTMAAEVMFLHLLVSQISGGLQMPLSWLRRRSTRAAPGLNGLLPYGPSLRSFRYVPARL